LNTLEVESMKFDVARWCRGSSPPPTPRPVVWNVLPTARANRTRSPTPVSYSHVPVVLCVTVMVFFSQALLALIVYVAT
jgi:hypothetical protein